MISSDSFSTLISSLCSFSINSFGSFSVYSFSVLFLNSSLIISSGIFSKHSFNSFSIFSFDSLISSPINSFELPSTFSSGSSSIFLIFSLYSFSIIFSLSINSLLIIIFCLSLHNSSSVPSIFISLLLNIFVKLGLFSI